MIPEVIQHDDLVMRRFRAEDAAGVLEAVRESGVDLSRYETWATSGFTLHDAEEYVGGWKSDWDDGTSFFFVVYRQEALVGGCGLFGVDRTLRQASLGSWITSSRTGLGYASIAGRAVIHFGFEQLGLGRIEMLVAVGNTASLRVCEKIGAAREGVLSQRLCLHGVRHDAVIMAVLSDGAHR